MTIKFTEDDLARAAEWREQGVSVDVIAEKLGVCRETFRRIRRQGFSVKPIARSKPNLVGKE